jgi:hypothetical protein
MAVATRFESGRRTEKETFDFIANSVLPEQEVLVAEHPSLWIRSVPSLTLEGLHQRTTGCVRPDHLSK